MFELFLAIFRVISSVLHHGNLQFKQERSSDQATLPNNTGLYFNSWNNALEIQHLLNIYVHTTYRIAWIVYITLHVQYLSWLKLLCKAYDIVSQFS